ncbi:uncharacterized protein LOC127923591 [Oncorhynchus keta]|uniref:uncharacterized protein LOC127923591 n=1 Tax=Oncorhynchus keta TaxID=8018 RepID=UPI00227CFA48|nr:uncharacterized protein LOC127923591 [Oncorhynchus keta]
MERRRLSQTVYGSNRDKQACKKGTLPVAYQRGDIQGHNRGEQGRASGRIRTSVRRPYKRSTPRGRGHHNLVVPARTTHVEFQVSGSLWNCRSAANKAEFISAYASLQSLDFLALTETWITTDNTATPTALSSSAHVFSHTPRASGQRGGGTGILISPKWSFSLSPLTHLSIASFEFHAVTVTSPFKLNILIIYRPPGSLGEFINELDALISSFPEDGSPLTVLGDFNLPTSTFDSYLSEDLSLQTQTVDHHMKHSETRVLTASRPRL